MGKKKVKPNAFTEFMFEFVRKERAAGRHHPKAQYSHVAKPHWEKLSDAEKDVYKERAKKSAVRIVETARYTSQGIPLEVIEREQRESFEKKKYMERTVHKFVSFGFENNDIATKPFHFIMADYFYKTHELDYAPAEIAIGKFTLKDGLSKSYHTFINPGVVKVGYAFEAKDRSERLHHMPPPPNAMGEKDYNVIYSGILDILGIGLESIYEKEDPRRPCVFVRQEDMEMLESILNQLSYDMRWKSQFDLFALERLFYELKNAVDFDPEQPQKKIPITVTSYFIQQDRFDLTPNIACDFHEHADVSQRCSLSYVRRWFFTVADHIVKKIDIDVILGVHLPHGHIFHREAAGNGEDGWSDSTASSSKRKREVANVSESGSDAGAPSRPWAGYSQLKDVTDSESDDDDDD